MLALQARSVLNQDLLASDRHKIYNDLNLNSSSRFSYLFYKKITLIYLVCVFC
jgi:hypothetical protein